MNCRIGAHTGDLYIFWPVVFAAIWEYTKYAKYLPRQGHSNRKSQRDTTALSSFCSQPGSDKGALHLFAAKQSALIGYRLKLKFNTLLRAIRFPNDNPRHTARINHFLVKLCMHYIKEGNTLLTKERLPAGTPKIINDTILFKALSNTYCCRESKRYLQSRMLISRRERRRPKVHFWDLELTLVGSDTTHLRRATTKFVSTSAALASAQQGEWPPL